VERIGHIVERIQQIQTRATMALPGRFQAILDQQLAPGGHRASLSIDPAETAALRGNAPVGSPDTFRTMSSLTLGAMLGSGSLTGPLSGGYGVGLDSDLAAYLEAHGIVARNGRLADSELVPVSGGWQGRPARLLPPAAAAWEAMRGAAAADGVQLYAIDTYRSWESQDRAHQAYLRGEKSANVLPPGRSQHGNGLAVDLTNGSLLGPGDPEWHWMQANGRRFGWHPISNESWHWEFRGTA
jgi:zinc D-Ala-D-Ala carboxypeptidase